jgi:hypothetical protein
VKNGLIEENCHSDWASSALVVKKPDGGRIMTVERELGLADVIYGSDCTSLDRIEVLVQVGTLSKDSG